AIAPNLIQGAQSMAVTAMRLANLDALLPRDRAPARRAPPRLEDQTGPAANEARMRLDDLGKLVGLSDPQLSPGGKSIVVVVSRLNYDTNRNDRELVLVDVATDEN